MMVMMWAFEVFLSRHLNAGPRGKTDDPGQTRAGAGTCMKCDRRALTILRTFSTATVIPPSNIPLYHHLPVLLFFTILQQ